jgi:hypothetical protein
MYVFHEKITLPSLLAYISELLCPYTVTQNEVLIFKIFAFSHRQAIETYDIKNNYTIYLFMDEMSIVAALPSLFPLKPSLFSLTIILPIYSSVPLLVQRVSRLIEQNVSLSMVYMCIH